MEQNAQTAPDEFDEMVCVGCGQTVIDKGGDETLGWLGDEQGWFCPECVGPECDLCGKTTCLDADLPEFSEPQSCALLPVYNELRYDRCEYGCGRDVTKASIRTAVRTLAALSKLPEQRTP